MKYLILILLLLASCQRADPGDISNVQLSISGHTGEQTLDVAGTVPFDFSREQIRPTLVKIIQSFQTTFPGREITIRLIVSPDVSIGYARYKNEKLTVHYGIPSDSQIKFWNSRNKLSLYRPDRNTFDLGNRVLHEFSKYDDSGLKANQISKKVSKKTGLSEQELAHVLVFMTTYYAPGLWGEEEINPGR